jgi:transcriptional regulator with GAF, ATPase, and Fis domain
MLGYLYLDRLQGSSPFTEEQRRFCDTIAPLFVELLLNAQERSRQRDTILRLQQQARAESAGMIYQSSIMNELIEQARKIAATESPVLVLGDTGSGKELMARFLHDHSRRAGQPFRAINCGAIPENLIESELFGHEKGAFTGASRTRPGLFESAVGGSVFLDEIGELPLQLQVKLLRVLQEAEVSRVGGTETIKVDVRIIAATNRNLEQEVAAGRFRQDLYFRLHVLAVELPPLHARGQDVIMLAEYFIGKYCEQFGIARKSLGTSARTALLSYSWPGNVRELENVIQKAVLLSPNQRLDQGDIVFSESRLFAKTGSSTGATTLKAARAEAERSIIARTLEKTGGNITLSAKILEIDRKWLMRKMEELEISAEAYRA